MHQERKCHNHIRIMVQCEASLEFPTKKVFRDAEMYKNPAFHVLDSSLFLSIQQLFAVRNVPVLCIYLEINTNYVHPCRGPICPWRGP